MKLYVSPGKHKSTKNRPAIHYRYCLTGVLLIFVGLGLACLPGILTARAASNFQVTPSPGSSTPGDLATGSVTPTLPLLPPTVTATATLIPLPEITFAATSTPTQALLVLGPSSGQVPPKEKAAPGVLFVRRWGWLVVVAALWVGLAIWAGTLFLLSRGGRPGGEDQPSSRE
jgi:hypothetical protein